MKFTRGDYGLLPTSSKTAKPFPGPGGRSNPGGYPVEDAVVTMGKEGALMPPEGLTDISLHKLDDLGLHGLALLRAVIVEIIKRF